MYVTAYIFSDIFIICICLSSIWTSVHIDHPETKWTVGCIRVHLSVVLNREISLASKPGLPQHLCNDEGEEAVTWDYTRRSKDTQGAGRRVINSLLAHSSGWNVRVPVNRWLFTCPSPLLTHAPTLQIKFTIKMRDFTNHYTRSVVDLQGVYLWLGPGGECGGGSFPTQAPHPLATIMPPSSLPHSSSHPHFSLPASLWAWVWGGQIHFQDNQRASV